MILALFQGVNIPGRKWGGRGVITLSAPRSSGADQAPTTRAYPGSISLRAPRYYCIQEPGCCFLSVHKKELLSLPYGHPMPSQLVSALLLMMQAALKRFQLDYVDLVFCHRPDVYTPIEETVRAMNFVIEQGWALYWGTSEWSAQQITEVSHALLCTHDKNLLVCVQYSSLSIKLPRKS